MKPAVDKNNNCFRLEEVSKTRHGLQNVFAMVIDWVHRRWQPRPLRD